MAEQRITITIDENGKINASTDGIKGEMCLAELQELLDENEMMQSVKKTDEYYQTEVNRNSNVIKNKQR
ncbi:MAG: DUF2997 domain-containing protein [Bacteroidales bacterium]|nr:DUF2997 domain-containing protein [Bacteroidales bacterium]